jgi:hypothetical protein
MMVCMVTWHFVFPLLSVMKQTTHWMWLFALFGEVAGFNSVWYATLCVWQCLLAESDRVLYMRIVHPT